MHYSIQQADVERDRLEIIKLWNKYFQQSPEGRYPWINMKNPAGKALCVLAKDQKNNGVVGACALYPRRLSYNGQNIGAGIVGDFVIDHRHRTLGPALAIQKRAIQLGERSGIELLYGFPNELSEPVFLRAGYKILAQVRRYTRPLHSAYRVRKYIRESVFNFTISRMIDVILKTGIQGRARKWTRKYVFETKPHFDERFDQLWDRRRKSHLFLGDRSSTYLNWRYKKSPYGDYEIYSMQLEKTGKLEGYIVHSVADNKSLIVDLLTADMGETLDVLLQNFFREQQQHGRDAISINISGTSLFANRLKRNGFWLRDDTRKMIVWVPENSPLMPDIMNPERWYILHGDGDV